MQTYQILKAFVSSPGDVPDERLIAEEVITKVSNTCRDNLGILVEPIKWEKEAPITPNLPEEKIQDDINRQLRDCQIFVLVLFKRYGSVDPAHKKSNTQREVELALEMLTKKKKIILLSYFRQTPQNEDKGTQELEVEKLKADLRAKNVRSRDYSSTEEFKDEFTHDLYNAVLRFRFETPKHRALRSFWQLGIAEKGSHPQVAIIYPPVDRSFMRQSNPKKFWQNRFAPHVVFEDFKAIRKIDKTLRLLGVHDFGVYSTSNVPTTLEAMNRVWICVPRNPQAQHHLEHYKKVSRFEFAPRKTHSESRIAWRYSPTGSSLEISSPLSEYLRIQRRKDAAGNWTIEKSRIIAKDFAVVARFSDSADIQNSYSTTLKDYFISGIRGLGTWGAAWFIDRDYSTFLNSGRDADEDIQLLLEITYTDERIVEVKDVSNEIESYFAKQNDLQEIKRVIKDYQTRK